MAIFDSTKCINRDGTIRNISASDIVDCWGTIKSSPQFDFGKIVDIYGNLGSLAQGPWEYQSATGVETIKQDQETLSTNFVVATGAHFFVSNGCTGYYNGNLTGTGTLVIQGDAQTIAGTLYQPGGLLVISSINGATGTLSVESGAKVDLGTYNFVGTGKIWSGPIVNSGQINYKWKSGQTIAPVLQDSFTNNAGGVVTFSTDDGTICQMISGGIIGGTTRINNGLFEIKNIAINFLGPWGGTGSMRVFSGATLRMPGSGHGTGQTLYFNGIGAVTSTGCCQSGALEATGSSTINSPIVLESNSRFGNNNANGAIGSITGLVTTNGFNLEIGGGSCQLNTSGFSFTNTNNVLTNSTITANGAILRSGNDALKTAKRIVIKNSAQYQAYSDSTTNPAEDINAIDIDATSSLRVLLSSGSGPTLRLNGVGETSYIRCSCANIGSLGWVTVSTGHTLVLTDNAVNTGGSYWNAPGGTIRIGDIGQSTTARVAGYANISNGGTLEACVTVGASFVGVGLLLNNAGGHRLAFRRQLDGSPTEIRCSGGLNKTQLTTIDLLEPMNAGTFTLLSCAGGITANSGGLVMGTNLSGRTVTSLTITGGTITITLV